MHKYMKKYNRAYQHIQYILLLANSCLVQYFAVKAQNYLDIRTATFPSLEKNQDRSLIFSFRHRCRHFTNTTQLPLIIVNRK